MKKAILILTLFYSTITTLVAQDIVPLKNKFGVTLSTNIFGLNDDLNNVDVGGGFYYIRKISNKLSIYSEIDGSSRNFGNVVIMPGLSGEFTTGNLALYIGPMFDIGKSMNLSIGLVENYLFRSELKTATGTKKISAETTNYSSLFFDYRKNIYNKLSLGIRYEWGINSILETTDRKVTNISFTVFLPLNGKKSK